MAELVGDREAPARLRLGGVDEDPALGREEHSAHVELPRLDGEAEQVLRDRLDRHRQLVAAEDGVVALAQRVRARFVVLVGHAPQSPCQLTERKRRSTSSALGLSMLTDGSPSFKRCCRHPKGGTRPAPRAAAAARRASSRTFAFRISASALQTLASTPAGSSWPVSSS